MNKIITTEEFIGMIFKYKISKGLIDYKLDLPTIMRISHMMNKHMRKNHGFYTWITFESIYVMQDMYASIVKFENDSVSITDYGIERYNADNKEFIDLIDSYFCAGIPINIYEEIRSIILNYYTEIYEG